MSAQCVLCKIQYKAIFPPKKRNFDQILPRQTPKQSCCTNCSKFMNERREKKMVESFIYDRLNYEKKLLKNLVLCFLHQLLNIGNV